MYLGDSYRRNFPVNRDELAEPLVRFKTRNNSASPPISDAGVEIVRFAKKVLDQFIPL
jgi:hypothetical protein